MNQDEQIIVSPHQSHTTQWGAFKRLYVERRGSDAGPNNKAIPRTTNHDVAQITNYYERAYRQALAERPTIPGEGKNDRERWIGHKRQIDALLTGRAPAAMFADNVWFWSEASVKVAIFLESRKGLPTRAQLLVDALGETVTERAKDLAQGTKDAGKALADAGSSAFSWLKTGAYVLAGLVGVVFVVPPVIRALRKDGEP